MDSGWTACPCGKNVLPEYAEAVTRCCVVPELMSRRSAMRQRVEALSLFPDPLCSTPELLATFFCRAFSIKPADVHNLLTVLVPAVSGHLLEDCLRCVGFLSVEQVCHLRKALALMLASNMPLLKMYVGQLACGGREPTECVAKVYFLVSMLPADLFPPPEAGPVSSGTSTTALKELGVPPHVWEAQQLLRDVLVECIDVLKETAFSRTFLEPCALYAHIVRDPGTDLSAGVHQLDTFSALLQATTGVLSHHPPCLEVSSEGVVDLVSVGQLDALCTLWGLPGDPPRSDQSLLETLKRAFDLTGARRDAAADDVDVLRRRVECFAESEHRAFTEGHVEHVDYLLKTTTSAARVKAILKDLHLTSRPDPEKPHFVWRDQSTVGDFVDQALDDQPHWYSRDTAERSSRRSHYAIYLHYFFLFFSAQRILPLLATHITSNETLVTAARTLFTYMKACDADTPSNWQGNPFCLQSGHSPAARIAPDVPDVVAWLWEGERLRVPAATRLLTAIDIVALPDRPCPMCSRE